MLTFLVLIAIGFVLYLALRGKQDRSEQLGAAHRPLPTGALEPHTFACPYAKCPTCGASGEKMKQEWDGLRAVKWTCAYCGTVAGVQTLKDEELPPSARQRLGLDMGPGTPMQQGYYGQPGGGMGGGGLLTGMMLGSMLGGDHHHHHHDEGGYREGSSTDWGESQGGSDWGESSVGDSSDWGDSGGGDFGGGDF